MRYAAVYSTRTQKSAIHLDGCSCTTRRDAQVTIRYGRDLESPEHARTLFREEEEADERGLPTTTIAPCARG